MTTSAFIRLATPYQSPDIENAVLSVIRSGWLIAKTHAKEFEDRLGAFVGRKHVIAVSSGTGALVAAMAALGIGPRSTVVVPSFTFPAPARAASFLGARVRLCDVDSETFNISADTLSTVLDESVSLVVGIDQFGAPCPAQVLSEICVQRGIPLLMDAACSLGATLAGRPCGGFGDVAILSFHPRKLVTTGQGGAVLTDDDEIAMRVRDFRDSDVHSDSFLRVGFDLRPHEMGCAMGTVQMGRLDTLLAQRRELAAGYDDLPFVRQRVIDAALPNFQSMVALLPPEKNGTAENDIAGRAEFVSFMASQGIEVQPGSYDLSQLAWIKNQKNLLLTEVPNSTWLHRRAVALPIHCGLTGNDVKRVVEGCNRWLQRRGG